MPAIITVYLGVSDEFQVASVKGLMARADVINLLPNEVYEVRDGTARKKARHSSEHGAELSSDC